MEKGKNIALVAHDNQKNELGEWVKWNYKTLLKHNLISTGTTGRKVDEIIKELIANEEIPTELKEMTILRSGPLGGDQQLGAMIAEGKVDILIFFWDPMQPQPHDVDVKALLRIAVLCNIPFACNRSSADFIISSPLVEEVYEPAINDYSSYLNRELA